MFTPSGVIGQFSCNQSVGEDGERLRIQRQAVCLKLQLPLSQGPCTLISQAWMA